MSDVYQYLRFPVCASMKSTGDVTALYTAGINTRTIPDCSYSPLACDKSSGNNFLTFLNTHQHRQAAGTTLPDPFHHLPAHAVLPPLPMNVVDSTSDPRCRRCGFLDPDLQLIGCSCLLHVVSRLFLDHFCSKLVMRTGVFVLNHERGVTRDWNAHF